MYNATSTEDENGDLETYENWLERQLISRIERLEQLRQHFVSDSLAFLGKILEEEMSAEMRTWLMELNVKLAYDR